MRQKIVNEQLKNIEITLVGPRLFCEVCGKKRVFSPCHFCTYVKVNNLNKHYCRGCGHDYCRAKYKICQTLIIESLRKEINKTLVQQMIEAHFGWYLLEELPVEIGLLIDLQILYLNNNRLKELPKEIGELASLQKLYIQNNYLKELPKEIAKLTHLQEIHLYDNYLSKDTIQKIKEILPNTKIVEQMPDPPF